MDAGVQILGEAQGGGLGRGEAGVVEAARQRSFTRAAALEYASAGSRASGGVTGSFSEPFMR